MAEPEQHQETFVTLRDSAPGKRQRHWRIADATSLGDLLRHALAGGERDPLELLLEDPVFWVYADLGAFDARALVRARSRDAVAAAHTVGRALAWLRGASGPAERAAQLGLSARQCGYSRLAEAFDRELERARRRPEASGALDWRSVWAVPRTESTHLTLESEEEIHAIALGTLGGEDVIVSLGEDQKVKLWSTRGTADRKPPRAHADSVDAVAIGTLAGREVVVTGSDDENVRIWNGDGSPRGKPLVGHAEWINAVAVGRLGGEDAIVSGSDDGTLRIWTAGRQTTVISLGDEVEALAISPRSSLVVASGVFGVACLAIAPPATTSGVP